MLWVPRLNCILPVSAICIVEENMATLEDEKSMEQDYGIRMRGQKNADDVSNINVINETGSSKGS